MPSLAVISPENVPATTTDAALTLGNRSAFANNHARFGGDFTFEFAVYSARLFEAKLTAHPGALSVK